MRLFICKPRASLKPPPPTATCPELLSRSYQLWDTAQAVCSSAVRVITTEALLKSLGVGDSSCVHPAQPHPISRSKSPCSVFSPAGPQLSAPLSSAPLPLLHPPSRSLSPTTLHPPPPASCFTVTRPPRFVSRDLLGKFARVFFCAFKGSEFDRNPKRWRLVADVTNDLTACCDLVTRAALSRPLPLCHIPFHLCHSTK